MRQISKRSGTSVQGMFQSGNWRQDGESPTLNDVSVAQDICAWDYSELVSSRINGP